MQNAKDPSIFYYVTRSLLIIALVLSLLAIISLPKWPWMYIARTHLDGAVKLVIQTSEGSLRNLSEIRFGIWGVCYYDSEKRSTCSSFKSFTIREKNQVVVVDEVKGLLVQPIVTVFIIVMTILNISLRLYAHFITSKNYREGDPQPLINNVLTLMNFPGLPLAILALTGALASTVHFNHKFHDLIESKLHNLGATEYGPGYIFTIISLGVIVLSDCLYFFNRLRNGNKPKERLVIGTTRTPGQTPGINSWGVGEWHNLKTIV